MIALHWVIILQAISVLSGWFFHWYLNREKLRKPEPLKLHPTVPDSEYQRRCKASLEDLYSDAEVVRNPDNDEHWKEGPIDPPSPTGGVTSR